jgi:hypothetical protein
MATSQKFTPQTKHIALKYHHFKKCVELGEIYIHTEMQQTDILTKPVKIELFPKLRYILMGWQNNFLSSSSINPLNIVPQGSVRLIGYGKPLNGPSPNPTDKPTS